MRTALWAGVVSVVYAVLSVLAPKLGEALVIAFIALLLVPILIAEAQDARSQK